MENKIIEQIRSVEFKIASDTQWMDAKVSELKDFIQKYDAYQIGTFVPAMATQIEEYRKSIASSKETLSLLNFLLKGESTIKEN